MEKELETGPCREKRNEGEEEETKVNPQSQRSRSQVKSQGKRKKE